MKFELQVILTGDGEPMWASRKEIKPELAKRMSKENYDAVLAAAGRELKAQVAKTVTQPANA